MGPIPHHMHQNDEQAALVGQQGKPESYYFPPQLNTVGNNFPYTFFGLEPGTTKEDIVRCLERWNEGDNGILDYSQGVPPEARHRLAGAAVHPARAGLARDLRAAVGLDVFGMYQSLVEGRRCRGRCWSRTCPKEKHNDLDYLVEQLDWEGNVDPNFKDNHYLEPIVVADAAAKATSIAGSSTARSTASSSSRPRN